MREFIKKYLLEKWWIPLLMFVLGISILGAPFSYSKIALQNFLNYYILFTILLLLISSVWQLIIGKWYWGVIQLLVILVGSATLVSIASYVSIFGPDTDFFADQLTIPHNISIEYPIDYPLGENSEVLRLDSLDLHKKQFAFQLYNSFQPGLYEYDAWISTEESGYIFLKAFELSQEIELSKGTLKEKTKIQVNNTDGEIQRVGTNTSFTIYEGDWGKPYGTRFEVWFISNNQEKKLIAKNYVIEGWMH